MANLLQRARTVRRLTERYEETGDLRFDRAANRASLAAGRRHRHKLHEFPFSIYKRLRKPMSERESAELNADIGDGLAAIGY